MINIDYILSCHGYGGGTASKDKTPPPPVTGFTATKGNAQVILTWTNPVDTDFVGLKILRKVGSYPTSPTDGTIVYSGANTSYTDTTVTNGTTYYYRAFTFDYDNNFNTDIGQEATATPQAYVIYGVKIDTTNSNPETAVTYIENSIGFTKATGNNGAFSYGSWSDKFPFNQIKPCVLKADGTVNYYLNPNNFSQKADGVTASGITGADGNVMIEFPKIYWKIETIGTDIFIRFSNTQIDSSYKALAHMRGTMEKDKCYIGSYLGFYSASKLRSLSGVTLTNTQTIGTFRTQAQTNGASYDIIGYYQMLMLQVLFAVMFKNLDSQTALGRGNTDYSSLLVCGGTNSKGMYYGETTGLLQLKCFGIEDLWGNQYSFIDGIFYNATRNILIGNQGFNDSGNGYTDYGQASATNMSGYLNSIQGTTEKGFIPKTASGSASTFYCDNVSLSASTIMSFGGLYNNGSVDGIFKTSAFATTVTTANIGARLMYL